MTDTAKAPAAFDPALFASVQADTADMTVKHPVSGEPTSWVITFAGPGHPQSIALNDRLARQAMRKQQEIERARVNGKKYRPEEPSPEERRAESLGVLVDQIVGWRGAAVEFSRPAALKMLTDPKYVALLQQINDFLDNERVFTKDSAKT